MAVDITISLSDQRETTLTREANAHTARFPSDPVTPAQFLRQFVREWLDGLERQYQDTQRISRAEAYRLATVEEQAQIDGILDKYRTA